MGRFMGRPTLTVVRHGRVREKERRSGCLGVPGTLSSIN